MRLDCETNTYDFDYKQHEFQEKGDQGSNPTSGRASDAAAAAATAEAVAAEATEPGRPSSLSFAILMASSVTGTLTIPKPSLASLSLRERRRLSIVLKTATLW